MKRVMITLLGLVALAAVSIVLFPYIRDELHWRWVSHKDQTRDYAEYLASRPGGRHADEAKGLHDERSWASAKAAHTVTSYQQYIDACPSGRHTSEAKGLYDERSWIDAQATNTATSYQRYIDAHPSGRFAAEAKSKKEALLQDDTPYLAAQEQGSRQAYESFLARFPGHKREAAARAALRGMEGRDIVDLLERNKVEVRTRGSGIKNVSVEVRRLVNHEINVHIPVGTFFVSRRASAQNMVTTQEVAVALRNNEWTSVRVPAACANRPRDIPGSKDSFAIKRSPSRKQLEKLMPELRKWAVGTTVQQAAVWIVTDNAGYDDLGSLVRRSQFEYMGTRPTRAIKEYEAAMAMRICDEAGIDITKKAIWQDRPKILQGLRDQSLKEWVQQRASR